MSTRVLRSTQVARGLPARRLVLLGLFAGLLLGQPMLALAQRGFGIGGSVGGVKIEPEGLLKNATEADANALEQLRRLSLEVIPGDLKRPAELRKVSLRRLEAALAARQKAGQPMDDAMRYLAGLQRIRYVFAYPEQNDIVIAGYAESWKIDPHGNTVGTSTGRPVMLLDDLIVALRTVRSGAGEISCSIDPTPEGLARLHEHAAKLVAINDPQLEAQTIEQLLGPQTITITGVPATTHFARVLVAADYRMKRLGMKLEPSPVAGLLSYVDMIRPGGRGMQSMTPRWWMVPSYDPLSTDADGLAWEIRRASVKALTAETFFGDPHSKGHPAKVNPVAQAWANSFTAHYDDLSLKDTIFGQLRNCMDMAVLAALVVKQDLGGKAGYQLPLWLDDVNLPAAEMVAPRTTETQVSFAKRGGHWIVTASGGVQLALDELVAHTQPSEKLGPVRDQAKPAGDIQHWWWD
jgi:hypothetical protein